jgi:predicted ABC-type ATPase
VAHALLQREKEDEERIRGRYAQLKNQLTQQFQLCSKNASCPDSM